MQYKYRQTVRGTISAAEIIAAYTEAFHIPWWRMVLSTLAALFGIGGIFRLADQYYQEMDEEAFEEFLKKDKTDLEKWVAEDFDCDDHEFRLHGAVHTDRYLAAMPIFITWVSWETTASWLSRIWQRLKRFVTGQRAGHAVMSYYKAGIVKIVEPQNDEIYQLKEFIRIYQVSDLRLDLLCG